MKNSFEKEVVCLSQMTAKAGKEEELLQALLKLVEPTRQERDCIAYEVWQDVKNPHSFIVYERFRSQEALEEHVTTSYVEHFVKGAYALCVDSHWDCDFHPIEQV